MIDLARARLDLHTLLGDMEAIRPFVDPNSADREPFNAAWRALLVRTEEAAEKFTEALVEALPDLKPSKPEAAATRMSALVEPLIMPFMSAVGGLMTAALSFHEGTTGEAALYEAARVYGRWVLDQREQIKEKT